MSNWLRRTSFLTHEKVDQAVHHVLAAHNSSSVEEKALLLAVTCLICQSAGEESHLKLHWKLAMKMTWRLIQGQASVTKIQVRSFVPI